MKGPPQKKSPATKEKEIKEMEGGKGNSDETEGEEEEEDDGEIEKGKENGKKVTKSKGGAKKVKKEPAKGTRSSARQAEAAVGEKRKGADDGQEKEGKKAKTKK